MEETNVETPAWAGTTEPKTENQNTTITVPIQQPVNETPETKNVATPTEKQEPPTDIPEEVDDLSLPGLLKELDGKYTLTKNKKRATCPFKPERIEQKMQDGKIVGSNVVVPPCDSMCAHFRLTKDEDDEKKPIYRVVLSCTNTEVDYEITRKKLLQVVPPKKQEPTPVANKKGTSSHLHKS